MWHAERKKKVNRDAGANKKQKSVCVFHLGVVLSIWQMCVSWESSPPEQERSVLTETVREKAFVCVCVRTPLRVHMCLCVHECLYAVYSEQLDCQTGV